MGALPRYTKVLVLVELLFYDVEFLVHGASFPPKA